jgi:hypothetical protein
VLFSHNATWIEPVTHTPAKVTKIGTKSVNAFLSRFYCFSLVRGPKAFRSLLRLRKPVLNHFKTGTKLLSFMKSEGKAHGIH